jgi:heptosyltransferase-2
MDKYRYKYLVIRFSSIGDIVLTTPVLRLLKKRRPDAQIHFVTKQKYASLMSQNPYVHKVHVLDDSLLDLLRSLRRERFDYVLDLHNNLRSAIIKTFLGEKSFSIRKNSWHKRLYTTFKINLLSPNIHVVDRYIETLSGLHVRNDNKGLDFFMPSRVSLPEPLESLTASGDFIAVAAGAQHATKKMPWVMLAELCSKLRLPAVLLGGEDAYAEACEVVRVTPNTTNACGVLDIYQSALILKRAHAVVAHDTGLMHIAAALKKNIVSVWGNTVPEFGMSPYCPGAKSKIFEVKNLPCRPCSRIGFDDCPKGHFRCMNNLSCEDIASYVNGI